MRTFTSADSRFCARHTCLVTDCYNLRLAGVDVCNIWSHECSYPGCHNQGRWGPILSTCCVLHRCRFSYPSYGCSLVQSNNQGSQFCLDHKCHVTTCVLSRKNGKSETMHCAAHECNHALPDCLRRRSYRSGSLLCTTHECRFHNCIAARYFKTKVGLGLFCSEHTCCRAYCRKSIAGLVENSDVCSEHTCEFEGCQRGKRGDVDGRWCREHAV